MRGSLRSCSFCGSTWRDNRLWLVPGGGRPCWCHGRIRTSWVRWDGLRRVVSWSTGWVGPTCLLPVLRPCWSSLLRRQNQCWYPCTCIRHRTCPALIFFPPRTCWGWALQFCSCSACSWSSSKLSLRYVPYSSFLEDVPPLRTTSSPFSETLPNSPSPLHL